MRTIGNIVTGADDQTGTVINLGALKKLGALLENPHDPIRKEACWTISNITAGPIQHIDAVICSNIIPILIRMLKTEKFEIQKETAWALSNITSSGNEQQIKYLVAQGIIPPLCKLLTCNSHKTILVVLEGLENILQVGKNDLLKGIPNKYSQLVEECGGLDNLEALQSDDSIPDAIFEKAAIIVRLYFDGHDDSDEGETITIDVNNDGDNNRNNDENKHNINITNITNSNNQNNEGYFTWNANNDQNSASFFQF